jgi:hypothetical protein
MQVVKWSPRGFFALGRVLFVWGFVLIKDSFAFHQEPGRAHTEEPHNNARTDRDWTQKVIQHIARGGGGGHFYSNKRRRRGMGKKWQLQVEFGNWGCCVRRLRQLLQHMTRVCHPESEVRAPINNGRSFNDKVVRAGGALEMSLPIHRAPLYFYF